jgi:YbbR domain-containing protein
VSVEPTTVTLGGDSDAVEAIVGFVENIPLDITGATEDVVERLALNLPEGASAVGVQGVLVTANIEPLPGRQTLTRAPIVQGLSTDLVAQVSPERISLTLTGPLPKLNAISQEDVQVYVELVEKGVGQHTIELTYLVPEGLELESIVPAVVDVTIARITPTPMPTPTSTSTPTPTPTSTSTPVVVPTITGTITSTVGVTSSVVPTTTLTSVPVVTDTATPADTAVPSVHVSPLPTPTGTPTPMPTVEPVATPTPTKEE